MTEDCAIPDASPTTGAARTSLDAWPVWLLLVGLGLISGAAVRLPVGGGLLGTIGAIMILTGTWRLINRQPEIVEPHVASVAALGSVVIAVAVIALLDDYFPVTSTVVLSLVVMVVSLLWWERSPESISPVAIAAALALVQLTLIPLAFDGLAGDSPDILMSHHAAAEALLDLDNPYEVVLVPATSPIAPPGTMIDGYPYPPIALVPYALTARIGPAGLFTVLCLTALVALLGMVRRSTSAGVAAAILSGLVAAYPESPVMSFAGTTEPWSALLLCISVALYGKNRTGSAIVFGLAAFSKQYLPWLILVVLLSRLEGRIRYAAIALSAGALASLPFFAWDPASMLDALVTPERWVLRTDSIGVAGFGLFVPSVVILALLALGLLVLGRRSRDPSGLLWTAAAGMTIIAALSPQSFPNYWFMVLVPAVFALILSLEGTSAAARDERDRSALVDDGMVHVARDHGERTGLRRWSITGRATPAMTNTDRDVPVDVRSRWPGPRSAVRNRMRGPA